MGLVSTALRILGLAVPLISGFSFEQATAKRSITERTSTCWYMEPFQPTVYGLEPTVSKEAMGCAEPLPSILSRILPMDSLVSSLWYTSSKVYVPLSGQLTAAHNGADSVNFGRFGERNRVATKSKLEQAVEKQAANLNDAQRALLLSQFDTYKQNKARLAEIDDHIGMLDVQNLASHDNEKIRLARRATLVSEKSQLQAANSTISANLFDQLGVRE